MFYLIKCIKPLAKQLEGIGWNALFIENHDQPRRVSTWGDDTKYWFESATSHAVVYFYNKAHLLFIKVKKLV